MRYATAFDVGERKRPDGINEDSVAVSVFEDGHREGYLGPREGRGDGTGGSGDGERPDGGHPDGAGTATAERGAATGRDAPGDPRGEGAGTRSVAVVVLADGAGGHDAGDVASYIATTRVAEELSPVAVRAARRDPGAFGVDIPDDALGGDSRDGRDGERFREAVAGAIRTAHEDVLAYTDEAGVRAYTTVVAGIVVDGRFHYGWVGDSRAYVCNAAHDHIDRLTEDHAVVEQLRAEGELDAVEAHVHPRGNELTRALGGAGEPDELAVDTDSVPLFAEDVLLLTSDGLPDAQSDAPALYDRYVESGRSDDAAETVREQVVTDDDIRRWTLGADSLSGAAERLVEAGNERGGKDNLSVLLCRDGALPETPARLPVRGRDPHPAHRRETVVEE